MNTVLKLKNFSLELCGPIEDTTGEFFYRVVGFAQCNNGNTEPEVVESNINTSVVFNRKHYTTLNPIIRTNPLQIQFYDIQTDSFIGVIDPIEFLYYWVVAETLGVLHDSLEAYSQGQIKNIECGDVVYISYANIAIAVKIVGTDYCDRKYGDIINIYGDADELPNKGMYSISHELPTHLAGLQKYDIKTPEGYTARASMDYHTTGKAVWCCLYLNNRVMGDGPIDLKTVVIKGA